MRKCFFIFILFLSYAQVFSQPVYSDKYWKIGQHVAIDFRNGNGVAVSNDNCGQPLYLSNTFIGDRNSKVLAYSEGFYIGNNRDSLMQNGVINNGTISNTYAAQGYNPCFKGAVMIPNPGDSNQIYMFYCNLEWTIDGDYFLEKLYYLTIDKNGDGGRGSVIMKDSAIIKNDTLTVGDVFALKHGNGKDWWIICRKFKTNAYYITLVDSAGVHAPKRQNIGTAFTYLYANNGQGNVSIHDNKMVFFDYDGGQFSQVDVVDFDRCTGTLFNPVTIKYTYSIDSMNIPFLCISPSGRYLYGGNVNEIYQFDLTATNIKASKIKIGINGNTLMLGMINNGPDGKIYVTPWGAGDHVHVINNPDSLGTKCNFQFNVLYYPCCNYPSGGAPNVAHFNLGPVAPCGDNGVATIETNNKLQLAPNPASNYTQIICEEGIKSIQLFNSNGTLLKSYLLHSENTYTLNLQQYTSGLYVIKAQSTQGHIYYQKLVVE